jgi:hypothetical protein
MTETDILNDLLTSNPNDSASKGIILLLRAEMKSEFRTTHTKFGIIETRLDQVEQRLDRIENSLELIAQNVSLLVQDRR